MPQSDAVGSARLLLERGADPNDRQALYNRMFTADDRHLRLLFDHGLGRPSSEVWAGRSGVGEETVEQMMGRQVHGAHEHGFDDRVTLLAGHGFALDSPAPARLPSLALPPVHRAATR